jgi:hypothetical protein
MHRKKQSRMAEWVSALVRLVRRNRGLHSAPRGGDPFPTGPQETYREEDPFGWMAGPELPPLPPGGRLHPYPRTDDTRFDLPVVPVYPARPYLNPILNGSER